MVGPTVSTPYLFAANSGMRSGELRKLKWEDVKIEVVGVVIQKKLCASSGESKHDKVRKSRTFYCVGGLYLKRWGNVIRKT